MSIARVFDCGFLSRARACQQLFSVESPCMLLLMFAVKWPCLWMLVSSGMRPCMSTVMFSFNGPFGSVVFLRGIVYWYLYFLASKLRNSFASLCSMLSSLHCIKDFLKCFDLSLSCLLYLMMRERKSWAIRSTACWIAGAREEKCMGT